MPDDPLARSIMALSLSILISSPHPAQTKWACSWTQPIDFSTVSPHFGQDKVNSGLIKHTSSCWTATMSGEVTAFATYLFRYIGPIDPLYSGHLYSMAQGRENHRGAMGMPELTLELHALRVFPRIAGVSLPHYRYRPSPTRSVIAWGVPHLRLRERMVFIDRIHFTTMD
jgi:hypothetical protein